MGITSALDPSGGAIHSRACALESNLKLPLHQLGHPSLSSDLHWKEKLRYDCGLGSGCGRTWSVGSAVASGGGNHFHLDFLENGTAW